MEEVVEEVSVEVSAKEGLVFPKEGAWWEKPKDRLRCPKYDRLQRTEARKTNKECQNIFVGICGMENSKERMLRDTLFFFLQKKKAAVWCRGGSNIYCGTSHAWTHAYCRSVNQRRGWFLF